VWRIEYTDVAERSLCKLGKPARERILEFFGSRVAGVEDPRSIAESLKGEFRGLWRSRVGDYRIICDIRENTMVVLILEAGHRKEIYR
jgi:mRNA interferase RelE/StbE